MGIAEVKEIYEDYIEKVRKLEKEKKPADGLLGFGKKISDDPCHDVFAEKLEKILNEFAAIEPPSDKVYEVLAYIYHAPAENTEYESAYWMLNAVHGLTLSLVGRLSPQDADKLCELYEKDIPRRKRLPVQKKVASVLKKFK